MDATLAARIAALDNATTLLTPKPGAHLHPEQVRHLEREALAVAARFEEWLTRPVQPAHLHLIPGPVYDQTSGQPTGTTIGGTTVQIHDNEQFTLTVDPTDAKGNPVGDTLTWSVDDGSVATLQVSDDSLSCVVVAGSPGSATITVTDGALSATEALDVIAGPVAAIQIVEGPVSVQGA